MSGIAGIINFKKNMFEYKSYNRLLVNDMAQALRHRGHDSCGEWVGEHAAFSDTRPAANALDVGNQPMKKIVEGYEFIITYNGELYNSDELKKNLIKFGYIFDTKSDTEVLLYTYIHYGEKCTQMLNGIYAFCIWDSMRQQVFICRDRLGAKPLYYSKIGDTLVFGSEIKALFRFPFLKPQLDKTGLCEIFVMPPSRTQGIGIFKNINELRPGCTMIINRSGTFVNRYWHPENKENTDNFETVCEKIYDLISDSTKCRLLCDVPAGILLSENPGSYIIAALAAKEAALNGKSLSVYIPEFKPGENNFDKVFCRNNPFFKFLTEIYGIKCIPLICDNNSLLKNLYDSVYYRDLPGMADLDSSLLYFCHEIKKENTVILSGDCSNEIFGIFPPSLDNVSVMNKILKPAVSETLKLEEYSRMRYDETIAEAPYFDGDEKEKKERQLYYLNFNRCICALLDRCERMSTASGVKLRMPFCDYRAAEYLQNIPYNIRTANNKPETLLFEAFKNKLPQKLPSFSYRQYSPQYNPRYEKAVRGLLFEILEDSSSPLMTFFDRQSVIELCSEHSHSEKPFFGRFMALPQFMGYLIQIDYWLREYNPRLV